MALAVALALAALTATAIAARALPKILPSTLAGRGKGLKVFAQGARSGSLLDEVVIEADTRLRQEGPLSLLKGRVNAHRG